MKRLNSVLENAQKSSCCLETRQFYKLCYQILYDRIYKIAYGFSKTNAKDLTQDIFLEILELDIEKLKPHADYIEAYLLITARNYCKKNYIKKKKIMGNKVAYQVHGRCYQIDLFYEKDFEDILQSIPPRQAIAIKMKSEGFRIKEIAKSLNSSESAVTTLINNGRNKLKEYFKTQE